MNPFWGRKETCNGSLSSLLSESESDTSDEKSSSDDGGAEISLGDCGSVESSESELDSDIGVDPTGGGGGDGGRRPTISTEVGYPTLENV